MTAGIEHLGAELIDLAAFLVRKDGRPTFSGNLELLKLALDFLEPLGKRLLLFAELLLGTAADVIDHRELAVLNTASP